MSLPSPTNNSPWPLQTQPPSQSRKRRILSPLNNRSLFPRQDVFNQSGVGMCSPLLLATSRHQNFPTTYPWHPFYVLCYHFSFLIHLPVQRDLIKYPLQHFSCSSGAMRILRLKFAKIMFSYCRHSRPSARLGNLCMCVSLSLPHFCPTPPHLWFLLAILSSREQQAS
jgi:hypothetical protein